MISRETVLETTKCNPDRYPQMLEEKFPHVLQKIIDLWTSPDGEAYLADLLRPTGGGRFDRDGFPDQAWNEILHLKVLYDKAQSES